MRILIAGNASYSSSNGQSVFMSNLGRELVKAGHQVMMLLPSENGRPHTITHEGVQIVALHAILLHALHPDALVTLLPSFKVSQVVRAFCPDIVHIHDHYPISRSVYLAARRNKIKVVGTNHFMPANLLAQFSVPTWVWQALDWAMWQWALELFNRLDLVTAPSKTAARIMRSNGLHVPVFPISCGVRLDHFQPNPGLDRKAFRSRYGMDREKAIFLFVGRVDGEKRLDVLIKATAQIQRDDFQIVITGKGKMVDPLKQLVSEMGLEQQIIFTGFVSDTDLPDLLNSADIFVMPSEAELLSISTLEAMACARPVLAAHAQALPELVDEGRNGYTFQPGNPNDLAEKMLDLLDHPGCWPSMGSASLEKVQTHRIEFTVSGYEKVYEEALLGKYLLNEKTKTSLFHSDRITNK